jgi:anti-sigma regulatory factor (Ser/Thr protein kinase)
MTGQAVSRVILIPNCLANRPESVELAISALYTTVWSAGVQAVLDMSAVSFIRPYGAVQLLAACQMIAAATERAVELRKIRTLVHAYLRRVDFFASIPGIVLTRDTFSTADDLGRSLASTNTLELHPIWTRSDIKAALVAADRILHYWLSHSHKDRGSVINLISEACSNVVEHSEGKGWMVAQKYERQSVVAVELAIADSGIGIPGSLQKAYTTLVARDPEYITKAIEGLSSKREQTSMGLPIMRSTTEVSGGYLFIRSGCGEVMANNVQLLPRDNLTNVPGTQVAMSFGRQPD